MKVVAFGLDVLIIALLILVFLGAAVILLAVVPSYMEKKSARCTLPVQARIVGAYDENQSMPSNHIGDPPRYAYIYEFVYNGQVCQVKSSMFSSKMPNIGEARQLMLDPNDLNKFIDPEEYRRAQFIFKAVGGAMAAMAVLAVAVGALVLLVM